MSGDLVGLVAVALLFGGGTLFLLSISPIGKAIGARILGRRHTDDLAEQLKELQRDIEALKDRGEELAQVRHGLAELAERMDFAERLLARQREADRLAPPR